jgi:DNA uptake protein ComE-like DNA-binding protein
MSRLLRTSRWVTLLALSISFAACGGGTDPATPDADEPDVSTATPDAATPMSADEPASRFNINTVSEEEMRTIPGVGDRMVHEFEEYRPYVSITQFRQEIGKYVDEETVAGYEAYIYVPVSPNDSDAETLRQLPGLDASEAEDLIAGRPYASTEAFMDALGAYVSEDELMEAESYLDDEG